VTYLASPEADSISGRVFVVYGGMIALLSAPEVERRFDDLAAIGALLHPEGGTVTAHPAAVPGQDRPDRRATADRRCLAAGGRRPDLDAPASRIR
jgi:hypothetical protein